MFGHNYIQDHESTISTFIVKGSLEILCLQTKGIKSKNNVGFYYKLILNLLQLIISQQHFVVAFNFITVILGRKLHIFHPNPTIWIILVCFAFLQ